MSSLRQPGTLPAAGRGHHRFLEPMTWLGLALGLLGFLWGATVCAAPFEHTPRLYASVSPDQVLAWITMLCGAATAVVNTAFTIYYRFKPPRKPRQPRPEGP